MSFRIIHYQGDKESLIAKIKANIDQLKDYEYKDDFDEGEWDAAVDAVAKGDFSDAEFSPLILSVAISTNFNAVSEDWRLDAYDHLANKASGRLADILYMFENGRDFETGAPGFGDEETCGYLTAEETKEFLDLIKAYTSDASIEWKKEFIEALITAFSKLAEENSGDLFIMN